MEMINTVRHNLLSAEPNMSLITLATVLVLIVTLSLTKLRRKPYFPPGPKGLPFIGNMDLMGQLNHRGLAELAKVYGGLFHLKIGQVHMISVSTSEMAREVLQAQDNIFSNRPANIATAYLTYDRADMAFAHYGPFWRQMRKICVTKIFSRKRAESWASVREEIDSLIKYINSNVGQPINVGEMVLGLTKNITYRAAFGSMSQEGQGEFVKIMQEFSKLFGAFNVGDFIPWLGWIHGNEFHKKLERARGSLDGFIDKIIDDHVEKRMNKKSSGVDDGGGGIEDDMVDEMMEFYGGENDGTTTKRDAICLTKENIKALIMDVMFGGTETVASAIEWAMAELLKSYEDLNKLQQELSQVVGLDRRVQESDLDKLPYLKCIVKETLRLHPPIPLLLHETSTKATVKGYEVPAKSRVMINAWAIGRDPAAWAEPDKFDPSRFLKSGAPDFKGMDFEYIPFGSGRRSCPGMQLGLYALELTVAHLCHSFKWDLPDGTKPSELDMSDSFGLTAPRAVQLVAIPSVRLNVDLSS